MSRKREILDALPRDQLLTILDAYGLEAEDRRKKDGLVDAIARSKRASLDDILGTLPRDQLKELCRALGLDDAGKEKALLIARLTGAEPEVAELEADAVTPAEAAPKKRKNERERAEAAPTLPAPTDKLSVDQLERYLWSAADILRGSIDSSDYKNYIFGILFIKRLSDVFIEEAERLVAEGTDPKVAWTDPDEHQFFIPEKARWPQLQKTATNIGEALNKACMALEEQNPSLEGVLAGIDFNDERKLGNTKNRDTVLHRLIQHFSPLSLANAHLSEPDMLGRAYEYLIEKFADDAGKKGGEFYTPNKVVALIVELLAPQEGMRISDPTCGSGGMLIQAAKYIVKHGGRASHVVLHGQEKNLGTWAICKMNMLLHGFPDARIEKGDTIRDPKLVLDGELMLYDRVIANPPFSLDEWGRDVAENDGYGRFRFGIPPKTKADLAFVQHMVATLNGTGMLGVVMPHGVLFRGSAEGEIRKGMLEEDLFEAVIGLPTNLFYGTGIPAAILVLNRSKAKARRGKVLFIDASREFGTGPNQNSLRDVDVEKISRAFGSFSDIDKYARVVDLSDVRKHDWNLTVSRYLDIAPAVDRIDVGLAIRQLRELEAARARAELAMTAFLDELGYAR